MCWALAERQSGDGGETVLMSRNVPLDDKPAPAILKAASARDIEIHNAEDWDVPDTEPAAAAPAAAADADAAARPEGSAAAAPEGGEKDALWEETRRQDAVLQERKKAEADRMVRIRREGSYQGNIRATPRQHHTCVCTGPRRAGADAAKARARRCSGSGG